MLSPTVPPPPLLSLLPPNMQRYATRFPSFHVRGFSPSFFLFFFPLRRASPLLSALLRPCRRRPRFTTYALYSLSRSVAAVRMHYLSRYVATYVRACVQRCAHFEPDFEIFALAPVLAIVTARTHSGFVSFSCTLCSFVQFLTFISSYN